MFFPGSPSSDPPLEDGDIRNETLGTQQFRECPLSISGHPRPLAQNFICEGHSEAVVSYMLLKALFENSGQETASLELPLFKKSEKRAMLQLNATTRKGPNGEAIGVICVVQDNFDPLPICASRSTHHLATLLFLLQSKFLLGFFIYLFSTLCGPVVSFTGAHGFVIIC